MNLLESILNHEGFRTRPYLDTKGIATFGHGLTYITKEESIWIVKRRISENRKQLKAHLVGMSWNRKNILIEMSYQMGVAGLLGFKKMWAAISNKDWQKAYEEMLDSRWAKTDAPTRAKEMAKRFLEDI